MNPKVSSKGQVDKMKTSRAPNRYFVISVSVLHFSLFIGIL